MKKIKTLKRQFRDSIAYWQILSQPEANHVYKVSRLTDDDKQDLRDAKRLHAEVYIAKGFVTKSDIKDDVIHEFSDPHQLHAEYFVVKKKQEIIAVARQIVYKGTGSHHESFPVLDKAIIYSRSRTRLLAYHPTEIVEISALVKKSGESSVAPLILYRALWRYSLRSEHRVWVMACDVRLYERLKLLFGPTLTKIGQRTPYKGADVVPVAIDIAHSVKYVQRIVNSPRRGFLDLKRRAAKFMIKKATV